jgi:uncharacterized lipoprotein YajG
MKTRIAFLVSMTILCCFFAGCQKQTNNITFIGTIEEVSAQSILVSTADEVSFDRASVTVPNDLKLSFKLQAGQTVRITILPKIMESYPVQVIAVAIALVVKTPSESGQVG